MKVYTIVAHRLGNETHSYTVAVTDDFEYAKEVTEKEEQSRAGKYACIVEQATLATLGSYDPEKENEPFVVYETPAYKKYIEDKGKKLEEKMKSLAYHRSVEEYLAELSSVIEKVEIEKVKGKWRMQENATHKIKKIIHEEINRERALTRNQMRLRAKS